MMDFYKKKIWKLEKSKNCKLVLKSLLSQGRSRIRNPDLAQKVRIMIRKPGNN